jgi:hypothetical protein
VDTALVMSYLLQTKVLAAVLCLSACGCAHRPMTKSSVIQIANHAFEAAGHRVSDYEKPKVRFYSGSTNAEWVVTYDPVPPGDGHTFWVGVDDRSGATVINHCR